MRTPVLRPERAIYGFGPFVADARTGLLRRDGTVVALTPKTFEVLLVLLERAGQLVTKEELLASVWPDAFVEENNLARHISTLRKALGEQLDEHRYVVTVPGRGYRFVADVVDLSLRQPEPAGVAHEAAVAPRLDAGAAAAGGASRQGEAALPPRAPLPAARWRIAVAGLVAIAAVSVAGLAWLARRPAAPVPAPTRALRQLTFEPGLNAEPAFSPDGQWIAYAADENGNADIFLLPVAGGSRLRLTSSLAHDWQPAWSPDGRSIAFRSEREGGGLFVVPAFGGGAERRLSGMGFRPHWSPDGQTVLFYGSALQSVRESTAVFVVASGGGVPRPVPDPTRAPAGSLRAAWHPDGRVSRWRYEVGTGWSFTTSALDGSRAVESALAPDVERRLDEAGVVFDDFVWAPSGRALYFEGTSNGVGNVWRITVDPATLAWVGGPDRLTTGAGRDTGLSVSADGTRMAFGMRTERTRVHALPFDARSGRVSGAGEALTPEGSDVSYGDVSAAGDRLVYRVARPGREAVWEQPLPTGPARLLLSSGPDEGHSLLRLSPDGRRLAMVRSRTGAGRLPFRLRFLSVIGAAEAQSMVRDDDGRVWPIDTPVGALLMTGSWSADGRWILGSCGALTGTFGLCVVPAPGSGVAARAGREITSRAGTNLYQGRFSPDQRWILFNAIAAETPWVSGLYAVRRDGGPWVALTDGQAFDDKGRWSSDGRWVYFVSNRSGFLNVWRQRFDADAGMAAGAAEQLTGFESPARMILPTISELELSVTRDHLYLPLTAASGQIWLLDQVDR